MVHRAFVSALAIFALWAPACVLAQAAGRTADTKGAKPSGVGSGFDLSADPKSAQDRQDSRYRMSEAGTVVPDGVELKEKLGPRWNYQPMEDGPMLEFGALGAGRKDAPRIMHFSLDWAF